MIVKSMSRKAPTFSQLAGYIAQDGSGGSGRYFARNLYYQGGNQKTVSGLFWDNYQTLPERKNGNALYHEIIVLEPQPHLQRQRQIQILQALAREYCEKRAPYQLAWGRVHFDTKHPHIHLMISANDVGSKTRKRLDRQSFVRIQRDLETFKEVTFPELIEHRVYNKTVSNHVKTKSSEGDMVRRTGRPSKKQTVADTLQTLFAHHTHIDALKDDLGRAGLALYQRGKNWGVENIQTGKRYRLRTLGLDQTFARIVEKSQTRPPAAQPNSTGKPKALSRAEALLKSREKLERHAGRQLTEFERSLDDGYER